MCGAGENPQEMKETKARERFFRSRPDGIAHHNENKIWYLMEFKRSSDVLPDYLERKDKMTSKQYEKFMNILRKAKKPGWTSDQLNFIVGFKTINENVMDTNLDRLGININQKNKKKIKAATTKANIHGLLNILKAYYANTHQDSPKPAINGETDDLQLVIDTRQPLDKRPPHTNQDGNKFPTRPLPAEAKRTKRPVYAGAYTSLIPQVNYTEGPVPNNPPRPDRTLLQAPSHASPERPGLDHSGPPPCPTATSPRSPKKTRTKAPKPPDNTSQTYVSRSPLMMHLLIKYGNIVLTTTAGRRVRYHLCLLLVVRVGGYIVNLLDFYSYRLIGKLTAFLQLQEFSQHKHNVTCSTSAARRSLSSSKGKWDWLSLRQQPYVST
jgi:hypothetical protein